MPPYVQAVLSFAFATFVETLTPGPTLALVVETRTAKGPRAAHSVVLGITLANIAGVLVVLLARSVTLSVSFGETLKALGRDAGAAYLIYLASRRILSSALRFVTGTDATDRYEPAKHDRQMFITGFLAHFLNPVTLPYYLSTFAAAASNLSVRIVLLLGAIPVLSDLIVYEIVATYWSRRDGFQMPAVATAIFRLLFGGALLYLVASTFSIGQQTSPALAISPVTTLLMLIGFLAGSIHEAHGWVVSRRECNNKLVWRIVSLWGVCFSVVTLVGALFTLIDGIDANAFGMTPTTKSRLRICFIVAAVIAASLNYAKAEGELQDERYPADSSKRAISPTWQAQPWPAGLVTVVFLAAVFALLALTDLRVQ